MLYRNQRAKYLQEKKKTNVQLTWLRRRRKQITQNLFLHIKNNFSTKIVVNIRGNRKAVADISKDKEGNRKLKEVSNGKIIKTKQYNYDNL